MNRISSIKGLNKVFKRTYWANFPATDAAGSPEIIAARNRLVDSLGIQSASRARLPDLRYGRNLDHVEMYNLTHGRGIVILCSNYGGFLPEAALGMKPLPNPIYCKGVQSYYAIFPNRVALNAVAKACKEARGSGEL